MTKPHLAAFVATLSIACGSSQTAPTQSTPPPPPTVYSAGTPGVTVPTVISQPIPQYTAAALAAKIQGTVIVSAVVLADGTVGDVTVIQSLDTVDGLDAQAVSTAKQWLFNPGMKDGVPVAVRITIEFTFTLR